MKTRQLSLWMRCVRFVLEQNHFEAKNATRDLPGALPYVRFTSNGPYRPIFGTPAHLPITQTMIMPTTQLPTIYSTLMVFQMSP